MKTSTLFGNNKKFHRLIIDRMNLVHNQPHPWVLKAATTMKTDCKLVGSWAILYRCYNLSKSSFKEGTDNGVWKYIHLSEDWFFFGVILSLLASTGNRKQCADIIFGTWERLSSSRSMLWLCHLLNIHKQPVAHLRTNEDKGVYHTYKMRGKKRTASVFPWPKQPQIICNV